MSVWLVIILAVVIAGPTAYLGAAIFDRRERIAVAYDFLRGRIALDENKRPKCSREHLEPGYVPIKKDDLKALTEASHELKVARGFVAAFERDKVSYADTVNDILGTGE